MEIIKKELNILDLEFLAMQCIDVHTFINRVNKSHFPLSVLDDAGDLESFYFKINGTFIYDGGEHEKDAE